MNSKVGIRSIDSPAQEDILATVKVLIQLGPTLGRPHVDTLKGSKISNLKELRIRSLGRPFRIFFVFDPKRKGFLLIGGNKTNEKDFYKKFIKKAEAIYIKYLKENLI